MEVFERILTESFKLFAKNGIRSVTMDDIAKHIGISKKTIYENFRDKDDLLKQGLLFHKENQDKVLLSIMAISDNVLETIYKVMFEATTHMRGINPVFFSDLKKYHYKLCEDLIPRQREEKMILLQGLIEKGIAEGIFRDDLNTLLITKLLNYQLDGLSDEDFFPVSEYSRAEVFRSIIEIFTRGIATLKGITIIEEIIERNKKI